MSTAGLFSHLHVGSLLYRQTAIWGFLLGWFICPLENYGEAILRANLERSTTALEDLERIGVSSCVSATSDNGDSVNFPQKTNAWSGQ